MAGRVLAGIVAILLIAAVGLVLAEFGFPGGAPAPRARAHQPGDQGARAPTVSGRQAERARQPVGEPVRVPASMPAGVAPPATATLVVEVVEKGSEHPVADFALVLVRDLGSWQARRGAVTDARGEARFDHLVPGFHNLLDLDWRREIRAGPQRERIEVERLFEVHGVVVDDVGRPVPGAEIWMAPGDETLVGAVRRARAAADGRFRFAAWGVGGFVSARHPGYAPSRMAGCRRGDDFRALRLVLGMATATVSGSVHAGDEPLADARVWVRVAAEQLPGEREPQDELGGRATHLPMPECRTGGDGRFRVEGVPPGSGQIRVLADGWAAAQQDYGVAAGDEAFVPIRLGVGATLVGTVARGEQPLPDVRLTARTAAGRSHAVSDSAGRFVIDRIPPGRVSVMAVLDSTLIDRRILELAADQREEWHIAVPAGASVVGRVVHADGRPAAGWRVRVDSGASMRGGSTDANGHFEITGCPQRASDVLTLLFAGSNVLQPVLRGVVPGRDPVLVRLPPPPVKDAWLLLDLVRQGGSRVEGQVILEHQELGWLHIEPLDASDGPARVGPLYGGSYELQLRSPGLPAVSTAVEVPAGGEKRRRVVMPDPVELVIELDRPVPKDKMVYAAAYRGGQPVSAVRQRGGKLLRFGERSTPALGDPLGPGEYRVVVFGHGVPHTERRFNLRSGEAQHWALETPPAKWVSIAAVLPGGSVEPRSVDLETTAAGGRVLARWKQAWVHVKAPRPMAVHREAATVRLAASGLEGEARLPSEDGSRVLITVRRVR